MAALVAACAFFAGMLAFGWRVLRQRDRHNLRSAGWLLAGLACSALWSLAHGLDQLGLWLWQLPDVMDWLRQLAWYGFLLALLGQSMSKPKNSWLVLTALLVLALAFAVLWLADASWLTRRQGSWLQGVAGLMVSVMGLVLVEQVYFNVNEEGRWLAKPSCLALVTVFGFDLYLFADATLLGSVDPQLLASRPAVHALGLPLLMLGIGRGIALLSRLQVSRSAAFHSAALLLVGAYLMAVALLGYWVRYTGGAWGPTLQVLILVAAILLMAALLLSGSARARFRVLFSKHFFRYRYDYRQEWLRFTAALSAQSSPEHTGLAVIKSLAGLVESPGGGLWLLDPAGQQYQQVAQWNFDRRQLVEPAGSEFLQELKATAWIVDLESAREGRGVDAEANPPDWLALETQARLLIPLQAGGVQIGFVVLLTPRIQLELDWEVRDLLKTAASQAGGYLAMLRATEQLLEVRKFDAFNRMSAFVVHDLKNIVTQLSLMLKNAQRHGDNPEFRQDMLETVEHALEKMRQLMLQLREGERPTGVASGVALVPIARRLQKVAEQRGGELQLELQGEVATRGHEDRIERVIGHAVQNAFDASPERQPVLLRIAAEGSSARVQVVDQGVGMSPEFIRDRLFKPFQSTKQQGMGIGAYESLQYVRELGGKMEVSSQPGEGTCVTFLLPLFHQ